MSLCFRKSSCQANEQWLYQLQKNNGVTDKKDADPERRQRWFDYQKKKYRSDETHRKNKLVSDMTLREHRLEMKMWKKRQQEHWTKVKKMRQETPPSTPEGIPKSHLPQRADQQQQNPLRRKRMNDELKRKLTILEEQLNEQKKNNKMYQKQLQRLKQKSEDTPRS